MPQPMHKKGKQKSRAGQGRTKAVKHNQFIASNLQKIVQVKTEATEKPL
jgi:hypothetical protein